MQLIYYTTSSVTLAVFVILNALHQRSNFYSACVYLAQSNACLMILTNVSLIAVSVMMLGIQKLFYGPLRPIEVEQLYEKAWFAVTETCLAMTIFREEVGARFFVMFVCLLAGKIWAWIGEGRVEVLEQQPPANPAWFHARLSLSLFASTAFDLTMLLYIVNTILAHARPNMMVMFAFEFAVLCVSSSSTCARYLTFLYEVRVINSQIKERRSQLEHQRNRHVVPGGASQPTTQPVATVRAEDPADADVPGWEGKGKWVFYLDLTTDFLKLVLYLTFFCVLCMFYGMPIHIIRDVALTIRSFHKRILDFIRYRQATQDMNTRYPDASAAEINREDCCIICREEMMVWPHEPGQTGTAIQRGLQNDERHRPKKLPCGHVLHFACLRSWLERQQNCPTCRAPVLAPPAPIQRVTSIQGRRDQRAPGQAQPGPNSPSAGEDRPPNGGLPHIAQSRPFRLFGARAAPTLPTQAQLNVDARQRVHGYPENTSAANQTQTSNYSPSNVNTNTTVPLTVQMQLVEQQLVREISELQLHADQLQVVRALQLELSRLRLSRAQPDLASQALPIPRVSGNLSQTMPGSGLPPSTQLSRLEPSFANDSLTQAMGHRHDRLPDGMALPEGWSVMPLHPVTSSALGDYESLGRASTLSANTNRAPGLGNGHSMEAEGTLTASYNPSSRLSYDALAATTRRLPGESVDTAPTSTSESTTSETMNGSTNDNGHVGTSSQDQLGSQGKRATVENAPSDEL